jgi:hypothetical protein
MLGPTIFSKFQLWCKSFIKLYFMAFCPLWFPFGSFRSPSPLVPLPLWFFFPLREEPLCSHPFKRLSPCPHRGRGTKRTRGEGEGKTKRKGTSWTQLLVLNISKCYIHPVIKLITKFLVIRICFYCTVFSTNLNFIKLSLSKKVNVNDFSLCLFHSVIVNELYMMF